MPRTGGIYSKPSGSTAVSGEVISPTSFNTLIDDMVADLNDERPITAGGTGATTEADARTNLGVPYASNAEAFAGTEAEKVISPSTMNHVLTSPRYFIAHGGNNSIGDSTIVPMQGYSTTNDSEIAGSISAGVVTFGTDDSGVWLISASARFATNNNVPGYLALRANGSTIISRDMFAAIGAGGLICTASCVGIMTGVMDASTVEAVVYHENGSAKSLNGSRDCYISGFRIAGTG